MRNLARLLAVLSAFALVAAAPLDTAVIIGSTNYHRWQIAVRSDGVAAIWSASTGTKAFNLPQDTVVRFFAVVAAARAYDWKSATCPNIEPFEASARVLWRGWTSADVVCSANVESSDEMRDEQLLNNTVMEIEVLAGPPAAVPCYELPPKDQPPNCKR
jgi:hypothetical protein